jgi:hypothetical protein
MKTSRTKFVLFFLLFAFAFLFITNGVLDQQPSQFLGSTAQASWQSAITTILFPLRVILMGPLLPFINFLSQDPDTPPPFFLAGFAIYWALLGLVIYYMLGKVKTAA